MSKGEANERHQLGGGRAQHMAGGRSEKRITEGVVSIWVHRGLGLTGSQSQIALTGSISSCYGLAQLVIPSSFFWSAPQHQTTRPLIIASRNIVVSFHCFSSSRRPCISPAPSRRPSPSSPSPSRIPFLSSAHALSHQPSRSIDGPHRSLFKCNDATNVHSPTSSARELFFMAFSFCCAFLRSLSSIFLLHTP